MDVRASADIPLPTTPLTMFLLPTILAALLATTAWAQFNSTAANGTDIPAPFNGAFNTDNATIIYPKAGNYCEPACVVLADARTR